MTFTSVHELAKYICQRHTAFNGRSCCFGCANVQVFDTLMRTLPQMNTCDIDCGVSFTADTWADGKVLHTVITIYKLPEGGYRINERVACGK